jgi:glutathione S-transferase
MPLKLLGSWASSYTHRVQLALRLKGLEFKYTEEDLGNKSEELQEKAERASVGKKYQMY